MPNARDQYRYINIYFFLENKINLKSEMKRQHENWIKCWLAQQPLRYYFFFFLKWHLSVSRQPQLHTECRLPNHQASQGVGSFIIFSNDFFFSLLCALNATDLWKLYGIAHAAYYYIMWIGENLHEKCFRWKAYKSEAGRRTHKIVSLYRAHWSSEKRKKKNETWGKREKKNKIKINRASFFRFI